MKTSDLKKKAKKLIKPCYDNTIVRLTFNKYLKKFFLFSFTDCKCESYEQFEASITRLYHTIEKGLAYKNYRAGFGRDNIEKLIISLEQYVSKGFDTSAFFYKTALSCLYAYELKNKEYGYEDTLLSERIKKLKGDRNELGGVTCIFSPQNNSNLSYEQLVKERHSIRDFSEKPVELESIKEAIQLAQYTPSACNRQGWKTRIIADKKVIKQVLANQNGNRGFGDKIDKLLVITSDLRTQQKNRELFQVFIDGGMYSESVLNSLFYKGIGSVPLSAALTPVQEKNVRTILNIHDAEILILFIGIGNYPGDNCLTTMSTRRPIQIEVI